MTESSVYRIILWIFAGAALAIGTALFFISAPYGRHTRKGWGRMIPSRWGWLTMEAPASLLVMCFFIIGDRKDLVPVLLFGLWQFHYAHRAFIYPFTLRARPMPLSVTGFAFFFNLVNGYIQGVWLFILAPAAAYQINWLTDPRFIIGAVLFFGGYSITKTSDELLRRLRRPEETDYKLPRGWLFEYVSCPNYLGEIIEWAGWALLTWSWAGTVFLLWTAANLIPRALSHHRWYKENFSGYPTRRKALLPFIL